MKSIAAGIASLLQNLDVHKVSGLDEISTRFFKETAEVTAPVLKLIFERSLDTGDIPYDWRVANVVPINKKRRAISSPKLSPNVTYICSSQSFRTYHILALI